METQNARKPGDLRAWKKGASCNAFLYARTNGVKAIPTRDVARLGPYRVRTEKAFDAAAEVLSRLGRIRLARDGRRKLVQVNPALLGGGR